MLFASYFRFYIKIILKDSYFDVGGGKSKRDEIQKNIDEYQAYITGKKFIPEFVIRKRVEVYVNDSNLQKIIEDEKNWEKFIVRYLFMMLRNLSIYLKILQTV